MAYSIEELRKQGAARKKEYSGVNRANTSIEALRKKGRQQKREYQKTFKLLADRNRFYRAYNPRLQQPKYNFQEALSLSPYGYAGVFGRSQDKQTVGLIGEEWQQAYALDRLRKNKEILDFNVVANSSKETLKDVTAADRAPKTWTNLFNLYRDFQEMGGLEGYKQRYGRGKPPGETSKYRILYDINNKPVRADDVQATYQSNLSKSLRDVSKQFLNVNEYLEDEDAKDAITSLATTYAVLSEDGAISTKEKRGEPNKQKIQAMEAALSGAPSAYSEATKALIQAPAPSYSKNTIATTLSLLSGSGVGPMLAQVSKTEAGEKVANNFIQRFQTVASSDFLALKEPENPVDVYLNTIKGLASVGIGLVPGSFMAVDEGLLAARETKRWATGETEKWGEGVNFELGDAIWADFAHRYYDPFAYRTNKRDGEDVEEFQGFWSGVRNIDDWGDFANRVGTDPAAYALDTLDIFPIVGWAAKAASVAGVAGKAGTRASRMFEFKPKIEEAEARIVGLADEVTRLKEQVNRVEADAPVKRTDLTPEQQQAWNEAYNAWYDEGVAEYKRQRDEIINSPEQLDAVERLKVWLEQNPGRRPVDPEAPKTPLRIFEDSSETMGGRINLTDPPQFADFIDVQARLDAAENILDTVRRNPNYLNLLDESQVKQAAELLDVRKKFDEAREKLTEAEAELYRLNQAYDQMPSTRTFRRVARQAIAGIPSARKQLDEWKALGYDFNGAENTRLLRFSALFEARTKVLEPSDPNVTAAPLAIVKMPASPLARGIKEGLYWVGRVIVDPAGEAAARAGARATKATNVNSIGSLTAKLIDIPLLGYRWNYTRATENSLANDWGDTATEMSASATSYRLNANAEFPPEVEQAMLAVLYGGTGDIPTNAPFLRRQAINDKLDEITEDAEGFFQDSDGRILSRFKAGTEDQAEALLARREELLSETEASIDARAAEFDELWDEARNDISRRLADPNYTSARYSDEVMDRAVEVIRRMIVQRERIAQRMIHTETSPHNIQYLRNLYLETMNALRIAPHHLFGESGTSGRIGKYATNVVRLNSAFLPLITNLFELSDSNIINFAQKPRDEGTVFDRFTGVEAETLQADWIRFVRDITDDNANAGLFRRGDSPPDQVAAPVIVAALSQKGVPAGFTRVHIPRIRNVVDQGRVSVGKIIDPNDSYVIPNEFLATKRSGKGKRRVAIRTGAEEGRKALETGSLNAMTDIYPNARFYSEKVSESGLMGVRQNEQQIKNEHVIAVSGLREHKLAIAIRSQVAHYRARVQDNLVRAAEDQAVLRPAEDLVGRTPAESGYRVLKMVQVFSTLEQAVKFANARGYPADLQTIIDGGVDNLPTAARISEAPEGISIRYADDGSIEYVARGTVDDWAKYATEEDLEANSIMSDYRNRAYEDPNDIPPRGMVLAVPNIVERKLSLMVIEGNTYASRLFRDGWAKTPTSWFKWFVLNARLAFIQANVIGGTVMMMLRNQMAAAKILARLMQKNARLSGNKRLSNWAGDSKVTDRHLSYEWDSNAYRGDSGIASRVREPESITNLSSGSGKEWFRKYIWNGGYTTVAAFERMVRNAVAVDFLTADPTFRAFMDGPEVRDYINRGQDFDGNIRPPDGPNPITQFEAAADLKLDRTSLYFDEELKNRMRYTTNTVSGNYHRFNGFEQLLRNMLMPFYAWQRHSLTYTWRMIVDKPITASAIYHISQAGYEQVAEQGLPDYLRQTIPLPTVLRDFLGVVPEDFVIDMSNINPFGATTELVTALHNVITGDSMGGQAESIFRFANPYLNNLIRDTLGIDPVTRRIDWERLSSKDNNGAGILGTTVEMLESVGKGTYAGSVIRLKDVVDNEYEADARGNLYAPIKNQEEALNILKNMYTVNASGERVSKGMSGWRLSIPEPRTTDQQNRTVDLVNALGFRSFMLNMETLQDQSRDEFVAATALAFYNNKTLADEAVSDINSQRRWRRRKEFVDWWANQARAVGVPEATIQVVLAKIELERPKQTKSIDPDLLGSVIGG